MGRGLGPTRRLQTQMQIGLAGDHATARRAHQESLLDQIGLDHVLHGAAFLAERRGHAVDAHRTTLEMLDHQSEQAPVEEVVPEPVLDPEEIIILAFIDF